MELETLRAKLIAQNKLSSELLTTAVSADRVASSMREGAVAGTELASGLSLTEDEASDVARQLGKANRELAQGAAQGAVYAEGMGEVAQEQAEASAAAALLKSRIDEVGDEAIESGLKMQAFGTSLDGTTASSVGLAGSLGPLSGRLSRIATLAAAATPLIIGLGGALGGLAMAGGAAAAGIGAIAFGGLQAEAERMAAASDEFEDSGEAMQQIMSDFGSSLKEATEPLQTLQNTELAFAGMEGAVELVNELSSSIASTRDVLVPLARDFGSTALETAPEIFDEVETTVRELAPALHGMVGAIEAVPDAIAWFREQAVALTPALGNFTWSAIRAAAALGEFGAFVTELVLPGLAGLLGGLAIVTTAFNGLPGPVKAATVAMIAATVAASALGVASATASAAVGALIGAIGVLLAPITVAAVKIGLLVGAVVGIISVFGWWDNITQTLIGTWNALIGTVQWYINTAFKLYDALGLLGPLLMPGIAALELLMFTINKAGELFDWLGGKINGAVQFIGGKLEGLVNIINTIIETIDKVSDALGIDMDISGEATREVDLSSLEAGGGSDDGDDGGDGSDRPPSAAPVPSSQPQSSGSRPYYDFRGADFSGSNQSQTEKSVQKAIEEANSESRSRQDGTSP